MKTSLIRILYKFRFWFAVKDPESLSFIATIIFLLICTSTSLAQPEKDLIDNRGLIKWQSRVNNLTSEIVSESSSVSDSERSLYLALLAKTWWKTDENEAREYLKKAADKLLTAIQPDDKTDRSQKFRFIQKALGIIAGLDEKLGRSLIERILPVADDDDNKKDDVEMANFLAKIGLQVVQTNPQLAYEFGMSSLNYGRSRDLSRLAGEVFAKDNKNGETLFRRAVLFAKGIHSIDNIQFVASLYTFIFDPRPDRIIPDPLRRSFLEVYAELIAGALEIESERPKRCLIVFYAPSIVPRFDEYIPALSQTVKQQVQTCIPFTQPNIREYANDRLNIEQPETPEACISAARGTTNEAAKVRYFMLAISKFAEVKKFEEIISLLDDMNEKEMKIVGPELWEDRRIEYTFQACRTYYKNKDMQAFYRVINRTPKKVRPYVRFRLRDEISVTSDKELYLENAEEIWKDLRSLEMKASIAAGNYLALMNMYLKVQPNEVDRIFRDAVKAINIVDGENLDYDPVKDYYSGMDVIPLAAELLEIDEISITNSLANISSRRSRVRLKLGLLEPSLKKYVEEKKKLDEQIKAKAIKDRQQQKAKKP